MTILFATQPLTKRVTHPKPITITKIYTSEEAPRSVFLARPSFRVVTPPPGNDPPSQRVDGSASPFDDPSNGVKRPNNTQYTQIGSTSNSNKKTSLTSMIVTKYHIQITVRHIA